MKLSFIDTLVLVVYFVSQVAIGLYVGRKNKSTDQYFLGGRGFSGLVIGISFIGSVISSMTFMAVPADSFKTAWLRFVPNMAFPVVVLLAAWLLVPFFRRGTITSAYQYLSIRFGGSISAYASVIFIISQVLRTSSIAYLLALLVGQITGWGFMNSLLLIVGATAIYTVKGGIKAVIWTDVIQTFVLLIGGLACIGYVIATTPGGIVGLFNDAIANNKLSFYDMNAAGELVPTKWIGSFSEKTVLVMFLVGIMQHLNLQFDQSTVQRWCTAKSSADARKSMYVLALGGPPVWAMFQFMGVCLFVFFMHHSDPFAASVLSGVNKAEQILPHFITNYLSGGLAGLVIAGAFAAGMSTLSSCINVSSMVAVGDIYAKYIRKDVTDGRRLFLGKAVSLGMAVLMTGGALFIHSIDILTLTDFVLKAGAVITVGIPAVFMMGMFTRRVEVPSVWIGVVSAMVFTFWVLMSNSGKIPEAWAIRMPDYYVMIFGNFLGMGMGYATSFVFKRRERDLTNLTVWDQTSAPLE